MTTFETAAPSRKEHLSPAVVAETIAAEVRRKVEYRSVQSGGAARAAAGVAELVA